jgi:CHASE2 domain-containing sensor protein
MKIRSFKDKFFIAALMLAGVFVLAGSYFRVLDNYELETLDLRFRARPQIPTTDRIAIIEVGDDTIEKIGRFPFDRSYHSVLVNALKSAGASAVIFDIFFSEPHQNDAEFVEAVKKAGNVYFPVVFEIGDKRQRVPEAAGYAAQNLGSLNEVSKGVGHINVIPDIDGKFRRAPAYIKYGGRLLWPYLSLLFACDYLGLRNEDIRFVPGKYVLLGNGTRIPLDDDSNIIVNFSSNWGRSYGHYSYIDILQSYIANLYGEKPNIDLSALKDKVCIVGLTAVGTVDLHPNPFDTLYPAVGMHAEVFNSILTRNFIQRAPRWANLAILIALLALISALVLKMKPVKGLFTLAALITALLASAAALFNIRGVWIDVIYPVLAAVALHLTLTLYKYVAEWKKRLLMENELQIAKKIQESFLPKAVPSIEGADIAASMFTAKQVGGDLYDFTVFGDGRVGVMIGDVSGKGVPAALFMAMAVGAFRSFALPGSSPQAVLASLNSKLEKESSSNLFVTMCYAIFDMKHMSLYYGNGGHLPILRITADGSSEFLDVEEGAPLGLTEGAYSAREAQFRKGDVFIFYTDGVTEAMNSRSDMYGKDRLEKAALDNRQLSSAKILEKIEKDIRKFEPKQNQHDDITLIVVKMP